MYIACFLTKFQVKRRRLVRAYRARAIPGFVCTHAATLIRTSAGTFVHNYWERARNTLMNRSECIVVSVHPRSTAWFEEYFNIF